MTRFLLGMFAVLLFLGGITNICDAQSDIEEPGRNALPPRLIDQIFERNDADRDGKISEDEAFARMISSNFQNLDSDGDGFLNRTEVEQELPKYVRFGSPSRPNRPQSLPSGVVSILESRNFSRLSLDDEVSERLHERFFHQLDPMKLYFLQSDIDEYSEHISLHDDSLKDEDLSFAENVYERYLERFHERIAWAIDLSERNFDCPCDGYKTLAFRRNL